MTRFQKDVESGAREFFCIMKYISGGETVSKKSKQTPHSYFVRVNDEISWEDILKKCGIKIKKRRNFNSALITLCCFHDEKTPSMILSETRGCFSCRGCGASGDKFDFMTKFLNNKSNYYPEKIRTYYWLKKNFNIPLPWEKLNGKYTYR